MAFNPVTGQSLVANAMLRSSLFGNQPRGPFPVVSPLQNIGRLAQAFVASSTNQRLDEEKEKRGKAFSDALMGAIDKSDVNEQTKEQLRGLASPDFQGQFSGDIVSTLLKDDEDEDDPEQFEIIGEEEKLRLGFKKADVVKRNIQTRDVKVVRQADKPPSEASRKRTKGDIEVEILDKIKRTGMASLDLEEAETLRELRRFDPIAAITGAAVDPEGLDARIEQLRREAAGETATAPDLVGLTFNGAPVTEAMITSTIAANPGETRETIIAKLRAQQQQ